MPSNSSPKRRRKTPNSGSAASFHPGSGDPTGPSDATRITPPPVRDSFAEPKAHARQAAQERRAAAEAKARELRHAAEIRAREFRETANARVEAFRGRAEH